MRKLLVTSICAMGIGLGATSVDALTLTIGGDGYIGNIVDGIPSNETLEAGYINNLITLAPGTSATTIGTESYNTIDGQVNCVTLPCPTATSAGSFKWEVDEDGPAGNILITGWTYVLAKYDASQPGAGAYVWYLPLVGDTVVTLPPTSPGGYELSHYTLFKSGQPQTIPDGGATLGLLGLAMLGLGYLRRRMA